MGITTDKIRLSDLTSGEARHALSEDAVILLPMGSLEDQGTHAPMGDYLCAEAMALEIARGARTEGVPTFVAPVIPFGGADYFGSSLGGISLSQRTFVAVLDDMLSCLARHGLKKMMIVNGHAGNVPGITEVALRWRQKEGMVVTSFYLWQIAYELLKAILGQEKAAKVSGHGADPVTSVAMHFFPDLIREDLMQAPPEKLKALGLDVAGFGALSYEGARIQAPIEAIETAPHGVLGGDPRLSSAQTGKIVSERLTALAVGFIRDHVSKDFPT